jgi:transcriptional regulator with XRE-family HTH domain
MSDTEETVSRRAESLVQDHEHMLRALVAHRKKHHLSQDAVADRMGVSQPTVAAFERYDSNPTLSTIRRYAVAVGARLSTEVIDDCLTHTATSRRAETKTNFLEFVPAGHSERSDSWGYAGETGNFAQLIGRQR